MKKSKKRKLKRNIRNLLVLALFVVISSCIGWYLQRGDSLDNRSINISYQTVNTKKKLMLVW